MNLLYITIMRMILQQLLSYAPPLLMPGTSDSFEKYLDMPFAYMAWESYPVSCNHWHDAWLTIDSSAMHFDAQS